MSKEKNAEEKNERIKDLYKESVSEIEVIESEKGVKLNPDKRLEVFADKITDLLLESGDETVLPKATMIFNILESGRDIRSGLAWGESDGHTDIYRSKR